MRTRNQAKLHGESPSGASDSGGASGSRHGEGLLDAVSEEAVGNLLKRAKARKSSGSGGRVRTETQYTSWETKDKMMELRGSCKRKADEGLKQESSVPHHVTDDTEGSMLMKEKYLEKNFQYDANEVDWEDGTIPLSQCRDDYSHELGKEVTVEFTESPSSSQRRPFRKVSVEDKELAELVHKVHLLCLIARGRLVDSACNDPLIQASLLSLLPLNLLKLAEVSRLTANMLRPLVDWVAALSVALFRALNLTTRFVSNVDVSSLKPDAGIPGTSSTNTTHLNTKISSSIASVSSPSQIHTPDHVHVSDSRDEAMIPNISNSNRLFKVGKNTTWSKNVHKGLAFTSSLEDGGLASTSQTSTENVDSCTNKCDEGSKRKGDLEFELQLAMALSATAATACDSKEGLDMHELDDKSSLSRPIAKKMRSTKTGESLSSTCSSSGAVWSRKNGPPLYWAEVYCSGEALTGRWVHVDAANGLVDGEEKVEAAASVCRRPLRYAVAFSGNGAKDVTRRYCRQWYRIASQRINSQWWDTVLAPLKELESGEAGAMVHLAAFQENNSDAEKGSSEVQNDLKPQLGKATEGPACQGCPSHVNLENRTSKQIGFAKGHQAPLKHPNLSYRNSLEDMELETRTLTEPLPTNQQAYKNHHLYAIEKWLTKYQTLHPKGPVVGYCSSHPVYPRSCVQTVHTRQNWLREGLQIRENESPTKVIKRSKKAGNVEISEPGFTEDGERTIELFGRWQLEPLQLPLAVNGIVPKNEYGWVDVWSEKCLPPGTMHLRLPRLAPVARRLEIDFAPAMVGFEFRNGRSYPVCEGIVVCTEFRDAIMEAYAEEEERREAKENRKNEADALGRWFQLLSSIITRQRLESSYAGSSALNSSYEPTSNPYGRDGCETFLRETGERVDDVKVNRPPSEDHEHVFSLVNQSLDEEGLVQTKRCHCGFSIQVEEL